MMLELLALPVRVVEVEAQTRRGAQKRAERRHCVDAMDKVKQVLGDGYEYERSGLVLKGGAEIIKYSVGNGWRKKRCGSASA